MWNIVICWIELWWQHHYEQRSEREPGHTAVVTYRYQCYR